MRKGHHNARKRQPCGRFAVDWCYATVTGRVAPTLQKADRVRAAALAADTRYKDRLAMLRLLFRAERKKDSPANTRNASSGRQQTRVGTGWRANG